MLWTPPWPEVNNDGMTESTPAGATSQLTDGTAAGQWTLDPAGSRAEFRIKHFWGVMTVRGVLEQMTGDATVGPDGTVTGRISFEAASLNTKNKQRDKHLRSADFFDVEKHAQAVLTVTSAGPTGPAELRCQSEPAIITSAPPNAPSASGALLTASAVVGLDLDADLVVLSACNSGGPGGTTAGESLSGLARAFFYAGARSLAVTHWAVNDQVAAFLVADMLRRMRENPSLGVAGALKEAQVAILADAGKGLPAEIAHPFFWAPFAVIGEGGEHAVAGAMNLVSRRSLAGL